MTDKRNKDQDRDWEPIDKDRGKAWTPDVDKPTPGIQGTTGSITQDPDPIDRN